MPHIDMIEPQDASEEIRGLYVDFQRRMGFPAAPSFIKSQGHSLVVEPIAMAGLAVYADILADATGMEADEMFGRS